MATISSIGIGSGLQANDIISKLVDLEKAQLAPLKAKATKLGAQMSTYATIKSQVSSLNDIAVSLGTAALWNPLTVSSSNATAVTASASGVPSKASYSVEVQQLARGQSVASAAQVADTAMGTGKLSIQLGTWSTSPAVAFTAGSAAAVEVDVVAGGDTMTKIAAAINNANAGVVATVITDSAGERLSMRSAATGEVSGFRVQVSNDGDSVDNDLNGLSRLAFDPENGAVGLGAIGAASTLLARNAMATLNGVAVQSSSNKFTGLVPGLSLQVSQITTSPAVVTVGQDVASIKKSIANFVTAYNMLNTTLTESTKYDPIRQEGAILQGDTSTITLSNAMRSLIGTTVSGATYSRLSELGIALQRDGSLTMDSAKLDIALQDTDKVKTFFTVNNYDAATNGFGLKLKAFTAGLLSTAGAVASKTNSLTASITANTKDQDRVNSRAETVEARLRKTYSALDAKMGALTALSDYVKQQVTTWNQDTA